MRILFAALIAISWALAIFDVDSLFPWHYRTLILSVTALWLWIAAQQVLANAGIDLGSLLSHSSETSPAQSHLKHGDSDPELPVTNIAINRKTTSNHVGIARYLTLVLVSQVVLFHVFARQSGKDAKSVDEGSVPVHYFMSFSLLSVFLLLLAPWYRHDVLAFARIMFRIIVQGIYAKVVFLDILLADILTSFSRGFGDILLASCSVWIFETYTGETSCTKSVFLQFTVGLPYLIRLRQCISELIQSKPINYTHLFNAIKYASIFPVLTLNYIIASSEKNSDNYYPSWLFFAFINTVYSFVWDIFFDFDLGYWKYGFLRSRLLLEPAHFNLVSKNIHVDNDTKNPAKALYYCTILFNLCARFSWLIRLLLINNNLISARNSQTLVLQLLELFRRFWWLLFRCERQFIDNRKAEGIRTVQ